MNHYFFYQKVNGTHNDTCHIMLFRYPQNICLPHYPPNFLYDAHEVRRDFYGNFWPRNIDICKNLLQKQLFSSLGIL